MFIFINLFISKSNLLKLCQFKSNLLKHVNLNTIFVNLQYLNLTNSVLTYTHLDAMFVNLQIINKKF